MMAFSPSLMFEHGLNPRKGWFQMHALDYQAKLAPGVTFDVPAGRTAHINALNQYEMGVSGTTMPIYLFSGSTDYDVNNPGTTASGLFVQQAIGPDGNMLGLVATGGYQIETTEFVHTTAYGAYAPNQLLTAIADNANLNTAGVAFTPGGGMLTNVGTGSHGNVKQYVDTVCGVVAGKGSYQATNGVQALSFWSYFLPGVYV